MSAAADGRGTAESWDERARSAWRRAKVAEAERRWRDVQREEAYARDCEAMARGIRAQGAAEQGEG
jgi:hypothetical protein